MRRMRMFGSTNRKNSALAKAASASRRRAVAVAGASVVAAIAAANVQAANLSWTGATNLLWSDAGNWTGGTGIPVAADTAIFGAAGSSVTQGTVTNQVDTDF